MFPDDSRLSLGPETRAIYAPHSASRSLPSALARNYIDPNFLLTGVIVLAIFSLVICPAGQVPEWRTTRAAAGRNRRELSTHARAKILSLYRNDGSATTHFVLYVKYANKRSLEYHFLGESFVPVVVVLNKLLVYFLHGFTRDPPIF